MGVELSGGPVLKTWKHTDMALLGQQGALTFHPSWLTAEL